MSRLAAVLVTLTALHVVAGTHRPPPINVEGLVRAPKLVQYVRPDYPKEAIAAHISGKVLLRAIISEQGLVEGIEVVRSNPLLDNAAITAVKHWRYEPATLYGHPVRVFFDIVVTFPPETAPEATPEGEKSGGTQSDEQLRG